MKKYSKLLKISTVTLSVCVCMITTKAIHMVDLTKSDVTFDIAVKTKQEYSYLDSKKKQQNTSYGIVGIEYMDPDAVTFSAGPGSGSNVTAWGDGVVLYKKDKNSNEPLTAQVPYGAIYGAGQEMTARVRNHNWTLNSNQIEGRFRYF